MASYPYTFKAFVPWGEEAGPMDWTLSFGRTALLEVEVGFGLGEFLRKTAGKCPDRDFVGVEVKWKSVMHMLHLIERSRIPNIRIIQGDVRCAFERLFRPGSIFRVHALFPVPWPKERRAKHRLFSRSFLKLVNSRLKAGGELIIVTDWEPYVHWILNRIPSDLFQVQVDRIPPRFNTLFERRWCSQGKTVFSQMRLTKSGHCEFPLQEGVILPQYRVQVFNFEEFQPVNDRTEGYLIEFKDSLYDPKRRVAMTRAVVVEGGLVQSLWIEIAEKQGTWRVRRANHTGIVPSPGVRRAIELAYHAASSMVTDP